MPASNLQIKNLGTEKTTVDTTDLYPLQESGGTTRRIQAQNLLKDQLFPATAQLSCVVNIQPIDTNELLVGFDIQDEILNVTHSTITNPENITIQTAGKYHFSASAQVGKTTGASLEWADIWFKKNSVAIPNSNARNTVKATDDTKVITITQNITLAASDVLNVAMSISTAGNGVGFISTTPTVGPVIPSIMFSLHRVG